jgi:tetratricopeptide (TPR) repeat protein
LSKQGNHAEALRVFRTAVLLGPSAQVYFNLGLSLRQLGRTAEAEEACREAVRREPDFALAHNELGLTLATQSRPAEAEGAYRMAIRVDPRLALAHYNLGRLLHDQGRAAEAERAYREAIRLQPDYAKAHCHLGLLLENQGKFADALNSLRRGHRLGAADPDWQLPSGRWLARVQRLSQLDAQLPAILDRGRHPAGARDALEFAFLCRQPYKQFFAMSARLYETAFLEDRRFAEDLEGAFRYNAARTAALAGGGRGDAARLPPKVRPGLRRRAFDWLRADLGLWAEQVDGGSADERAGAERMLGLWRGGRRPRPRPRPGRPGTTPLRRTG